MKITPGSLSVLLLMAIAAGCSTPASRIEDHAAAFAAWPPAVQARIRSGEIAVGDTAEMVEVALGRPDAVLRRQTREGESEVWVFRDKSPRLSFGIGVGGWSGHTGGGAAVQTDTGDADEWRLRVILRAGRVQAIERQAR